MLGYQNTAANLVAGPNAMLLHLPARELGPVNFVPVGEHRGILKSMVRAVTPVAGAVSRGAVAPGAQVFTHDVYTVVVASDAAAIPAALGRVPDRQRPVLAPELLEFYQLRYSGFPLALCCFDNAEAQEAKPLLIWYHPLDPGLLTVPAIDSHTGAAPDLKADVPVDHWVLFGSDQAPPEWGTRVRYPGGPPPELGQFLPAAVAGQYFGNRTMPNGDFALKHADLLAGRLNRIGRFVPA